jgi:hypothetical protein
MGRRETGYSGGQLSLELYSHSFTRDFGKCRLHDQCNMNFIMLPKYKNEKAKDKMMIY